MDFYLILDGHARLTVPRRKTVELGPGDYFGEISVLDGGPRTANVTALSHVVALRIERGDFVPLLSKVIGRLPQVKGVLVVAESWPWMATHRRLSTD
jgi:CRP-like cAMP-binding protein